MAVLHALQMLSKDIIQQRSKCGHPKKTAPLEIAINQRPVCDLLAKPAQLHSYELLKCPQQQRPNN
jgi:hypothetical protein